VIKRRRVRPSCIERDILSEEGEYLRTRENLPSQISAPCRDVTGVELPRRRRLIVVTFLHQGVATIPITTFTSPEFNQDTSRAKKAASQGPVFITDRG
jgi:hypothetical protein